MKIVNLQTFLGLPSGTVFFHYVEDNFDLEGRPALMIKMATVDEDHYEAMSLATDTNNHTLLKLSKFSESGESFDIDQDIQTFDGQFKPEQMYAVFEEKDAHRLISLLVLSFADAGLIKQGVAFEIDQLANHGQPPEEGKPFAVSIDPSAPVDVEGKLSDIVIFDAPTFRRPRSVPPVKTEFTQDQLEMIESITTMSRPSFHDSEGNVHASSEPLKVPRESLIMLEKTTEWVKVKVVKDCEFEQAVQQGFSGTPERWQEVKDWYVRSLIKSRNTKQIEVDYTNILFDSTGGLVDADGQTHTSI